MLISSMRGSADQRAAWGLLEAGECSMTADDLMQLYDRQNGQCFYSDIPMTLQQKMSWKASPERLDTQKGYVLENVVLVCNEFNGYAQMSRARISAMLERTTILPPLALETVKSYWMEFKNQYASSHSAFDLMTQYNAQNGRCSYSGAAFTLDSEDAYHRPFIVETSDDHFILILTALWVSPLCRWSKEKFATLRDHFEKS